MKRAILIVSFGTSYPETRKATIEVIENRVTDIFTEYTVKRAFTSHIIIKKIREQENIIVNTPEEALQELLQEGFEEVIIQPLHLIPGVEFDYVKIIAHKHKKDFKEIRVGRPLLYYKCEEEGIDDYVLMAKALKLQIKKEQNVLLMGHGTSHFANAVYPCMQMVLEDEGMGNVYIANVEGYPYINNVLKKLLSKGIKEITLMPFMLVAGDHAQNDMASDNEDSFKSILEAHGIKANVYMHGLGENEEIQNIYIQHLMDTINNTYQRLGKNKKGKKK